MDMIARAQGRIPGISQLLSKRPEQFAPGSWPTYFSHASGVNIWDLDGNEYIDMSIGGIGANVLGYCDPDVDRAVMDAVRKGNSSSLNCPEEVELADLLCELHPWAQKVRYARTGGEAMAIAVRIARTATGRDKVAFCGYHGWHDWYLAANISDDTALDGHLLPGLNPAGVPRNLKGTALPFQYNKLDELENIIKISENEIAAIVMEPIRNHPPEPGFLSGCKKLAESIGAVLIFDEISAAFRMNTGGAHLNFGITPDIAVFSKALGNGYPISAIIGVSNIMECACQSFISSTNWTERIGPCAAIATIKKHHEKGVGQHFMKIGLAVQKGWSDIGKKNNLQLEIGGIPPLSHFSFKVDQPLLARAYFVELMMEKGFLAGGSFYPMYPHTMDHVKEYLIAAELSFESIASAINNNCLRNKVKGNSASSGFTRLT